MPGVPAELRAALAPGTAETWEALAPHLPAALYLGGGTAVAVHLRHRESADLDFFYHNSSVELDKLAEQLSSLGPFAITRRAPGTLRGLFDGTKVEFLHADEVHPQVLLREPTQVAGLRVATLEDLMAMKLKVIGDRGEARDYFDVMSIDENGAVTLEDGIALFLERYELAPSSEAHSSYVKQGTEIAALTVIAGRVLEVVGGLRRMRWKCRASWRLRHLRASMRVLPSASLRSR